MATSLVGDRPQRRDALRWRERVVEPGHRIRRSSIAAILPLVEDGLTRGDVDKVALAELQAAFADLRRPSPTFARRCRHTVPRWSWEGLESSAT
jgi:hypothetical protein